MGFNIALMRRRRLGRFALRYLLLEDSYNNNILLESGGKIELE
jgi:hypothetical protein